MPKSDELTASNSDNWAYQKAHSFLDLLFKGVTGGYAEMLIKSTLARGKGELVYIELPIAKEVKRLSSLINEKKDHEISFSPAPRAWIDSKHQKKGNSANISSIGCIWAEISYQKAPGGSIGAIELIDNLQLKPSLVTNYGDKNQLYYVLNAALRDRGLLEWKELMRKLSALVSSDEKINPAEYLPLPGSLNIKFTPDFECRVCEDQSSLVQYSIEELREFLSEALPEIQNRLHSSKDQKLIEYSSGAENYTDYSSTRDDLVARKVPLKVIEAIFSGRVQSSSAFDSEDEDKRFNRDVWISQNLISRNFTEREIRSVFQNNPGGCGDKWAASRNAEKYLNKVLLEAVSKLRNRRSIGKGNDDLFHIATLPQGYELKEDGSVWLITPSEKTGKEPKSTFVSNSILRISEIRENIDTNQISVGISYNYLGKNRTTTILRSQMCNTRSLVALLSGEGAPINSNNARQIVAFLADYEQAFAEVIPRKTVTSRFGRARRTGNKFYLPGLAAEVEYSPVAAGDQSIYKAYAARAGTLHDWVEVINRLEQNGFMIPQIAVLAALVPPLQAPLQIPNFILDIYGNTSSGKSTTLRLAASVYGRPYDPDSLINQWMNTKSAVEQLAGMCSELPIFLDDAQHCSDDLKRSVIYMIANGKGKGRGAGGAGGIQETLSWHTVALSTSEEPLHQSSPHEGVRGRLLPVGGLLSPFPANSSAVVQGFDKAIQSNYGYAGEAFIRHLNGWNEKDWIKWQKRYSMLRAELSTNSSSNIVGRVGGYIAGIGVTAEIVCPLLGLSFKPDILVAWLLNHTQEQQYNQNLVILALRALGEHYLSNLNAFAGTEQFQAPKGKSLQGVSKKGQYVGFMRNTLDAVFLKRRWNQTMMLNKLSEAGVLIATETDRHTKKVSVEGINYRLICIKWSAILPDDLL